MKSEIKRPKVVSGLNVLLIPLTCPIEDGGRPSGTARRERFCTVMNIRGDSYRLKERKKIGNTKINEER